MDAIKNLSDFESYVSTVDLNNEDNVYDILGFVIASNDKSMFDFFVNKKLSASMREVVRETLEDSDEYKEWADNIAHVAKTSIDLVGDSSMDNDPVDKEFAKDPMAETIEKILAEDKKTKTKKPKKKVSTYSFATTYDYGYLNNDNDDSGGDDDDDDEDDDDDSFSSSSSSDDEFIKELERSLTLQSY